METQAPTPSLAPYRAALVLGVAFVLVLGLIAGIHQTWGAPVRLAFFDATPPGAPTPQAEQRKQWKRQARWAKDAKPYRLSRGMRAELEVDTRTRGELRNLGLLGAGFVVAMLSAKQLLGLVVGGARAHARTVGFLGDSPAGLIVDLVGGGSALQLPRNASDPAAGTLSPGTVWEADADGVPHFADTLTGVIRSVRPWKGYLTVSSSTSSGGTAPTNGGGDYGSEWPSGSTTNSWLECFTAAAAAGQAALVVGTFAQAATTVLTTAHNGLTIRFSATVTMPGSVDCLQVNGTQFLTIVGQLTVLGNNSTGSFLHVTGTSYGIDVQWSYHLSTASEFAAPAAYSVLVDGSTSNVKIRGQTILDFHGPIRIINPYNVEISGIESVSGGMTGSPSETVIFIGANQTSGVYGNVWVHHVFLNCGGNANAHPGLSAGPVTIGTSVQPVNIHVSDVTFVNFNPPSGGTHGDGMDIQANYCIIENCRVDSAGAPFDMQGSYIAVTNCIATNNYFSGFQAGDAADGWACQYITFTNCISIDNGRGVSGATSAGLYVSNGFPGAAWSSLTAYVAGNIVRQSGISYVCILANTNQQPPNATYWTALSGNTSNVTFDHCTSVTPGSYTNYGISIAVTTGSAGTISSVVVEGGWYGGVTAGQLQTPGSGTISSVYYIDAFGLPLVTQLMSTVTSYGNNPAGTASTTLVAAGLQVAFTPRLTGIVRITVSLNGSTATAAVKITWQIYVGTSALSNGSALSGGAAVGSNRVLTSTGAGVGQTQGASVVKTGLTVGTTYYMDVGFDTVNASDTATLSNVDVTIEELRQ